MRDDIRPQILMPYRQDENLGGDLPVFAGAAAALAAVVLAAGYLPARSAASTAPMDALRND